MKKVILLYAFLLPVLLKAQQSSKKVSFYAQGGYRSSLYIIEAGKQNIVSETETRHHRCIILNAGLQWNISEYWRIGPSFTYDHFGTKRRSIEYSTLSYLLRCDRIWEKTKNHTFYSGLAAGPKKARKFEDEKEIEKKLVLGYQVYLIGINYKVLNKFSLDANAGWGESGILNIGMNYRF